MRDHLVWSVVCVSAIVVGAVFAVVVPSAPAHAQYVGSDGIHGGGAGGGAFSGGTLTSGLTFSDVATDVTTGTNEDFVIDANGTGKTDIKDVLVADGITVGGCNTVGLQFGTSTTTGICDSSGGTRPRWISNNVAVFEASSTLGFSNFLDYRMASNFQVSLGARTALTVSTSTSPSGVWLGLSSSGAVNWTPGTSGRLSGSMVFACNVDAESDVITMTDGASYEGSGCALGVNDCVTMIYDNSSSKWRELSCNNN